MRSHVRSITCTAAMALGLAPAAFAQTNSPAPAQEWTVITTSHIKPEFRQEYEAGQKELTAAYIKGGAPYRIVLQTMLGDMMEYTTVVPLGKFAEFDAPTPVVKALGDMGSQKLLKRVGAYLMDVHRATELSMPDISINTPMENMGKYAQVSIIRLFPGKAAEFASFMKDDYLPAMRKGDIANLWTSRPVFGGDLNERVTVMPMQRMAQLDGGPVLTKAVGADAARKINEKRNTIVESTRYMVVQVRTDLSHMPSMAPGAKPAAE